MRDWDEMTEAEQEAFTTRVEWIEEMVGIEYGDVWTPDACNRLVEAMADAVVLRPGEIPPWLEQPRIGDHHAYWNPNPMGGATNLHHDDVHDYHLPLYCRLSGEDVNG